jgi:hypothetical protein
MAGRLSRPAITGPHGKNDTRLQTLVPELVAIDVRKLCHELHCTDSELIRTLVLQRLYGDETAEALQVTRYRAMVGIGSGIQGAG